MCRLRHRWLTGFVIFAVLAVVALGVGSWLGSSALMDPHHYQVSKDIKVLAVRPGAVVLQRTPVSAKPGVYGLIWDGGHAIIGDVLAENGPSVTRQLRTTSGTLAAKQKAGIDIDVWESNPQVALGIPFRSIAIPDPVGPMPAWCIAGPRSTWVIFVHGIDGSRAAGLRILPTLRKAGFPTLLISYRNDLGAPRSPDGQVHLGMTEWEELDAAARYAIAHGAHHLVLIGESMGGAIVTRFMHLSKLAAVVRALVLDAPVLNWRTVISYVASRHHIGLIARPVEWAIAARINIDWDALDELSQTHEFHVPILLFQGLEDQDVPPSESAAFAHALPHLVTYVPVPHAGHVESWNVNPSLYDEHLAEFLATNG